MVLNVVLTLLGLTNIVIVIYNVLNYTFLINNYIINDKISFGKKDNCLSGLIMISNYLQFFAIIIDFIMSYFFIFKTNSYNNNTKKKCYPLNPIVNMIILINKLIYKDNIYIFQTKFKYILRLIINCSFLTGSILNLYSAYPLNCDIELRIFLLIVSILQLFQSIFNI